MFKRSAFSLLIAGSLAFAVVPHASANDAAVQNALKVLDAQLPGKLISNPYDIRWKTEGSDKKESIVEAPGIPGGMAYSVRVKKKKRKSWDTATRLPMTTSIEKDDVIMVSFWARSSKPPKGSDVGKITVALQRNIEPYDSIINEPIAPTQEWKLYKVAGKANRDFAADKTNLNYNLAHAKQTVEFGQYYVVSLGPDANPDDYTK